MGAKATSHQHQTEELSTIILDILAGFGKNEKRKKYHKNCKVFSALISNVNTLFYLHGENFLFEFHEQNNILTTDDLLKIIIKVLGNEQSYGMLVVILVGVKAAFQTSRISQHSSFPFDLCSIFTFENTFGGS